MYILIHAYHIHMPLHECILILQTKHTHTDPAQRPLLPKLGIAPVVTIHESNLATSNPEKMNSPDFFKPKFNKFVTAKKEV